MAKRRKVGNLLALAVLGTVVQRPMHPYEMASFLRARGKDQDMPIKWGSLYTVVQNMAKHGFLEATESERQGARPERTIYRITDAGRAELRDWVRELVANPEREQTKFKAALSMLGALTPDEAIDLLRQRIAKLTADVSSQRESLTRDLGGIPRLFLVEEEYELAIREAEVRWVAGLLKEFESCSFPDIEMWRAFHATGAVPPEYQDLAERGTEE